jgi:hypothetical protein
MPKQSSFILSLWSSEISQQACIFEVFSTKLGPKLVSFFSIIKYKERSFENESTLLNYVTHTYSCRIICMSPVQWCSFSNLKKGGFSTMKERIQKRRLMLRWSVRLYSSTLLPVVSAPCLPALMMMMMMMMMMTDSVCLSVFCLCLLSVSSAVSLMTLCLLL